MRLLPVCIVICLTAVMGIACTRQPEPVAAPAPPAPTSGWHEDDSTAVAEALVEAALADPWSGRFRDRSSRVPVVAVGVIDDRSGDHVDVAAFAQALAARLAASPNVALATPDQTPDMTLSGTISLAQVQGEARYQVDLRVRNAAGDAEWQSGLERRRSAP